MIHLTYSWSAGNVRYSLDFVHVAGTSGVPYSFGQGGESREIEVRDFLMATLPVTQALWNRVMDSDTNPAVHRGEMLPLENLSWDAITQRGGFLERINASPVRAELANQLGREATFRLPSETEWEYAARGGPHWRDGFRFSGSNDVDAVAWYDRRHGDHTQPVGLRAANQLGIYDMSGNVWEWCQDAYTPDVTKIPADGKPFSGDGDERVLRGGCFHNWAVHCTVWKRYEIGRQYHDGCIGFRLVLAPA